MSHDDLRKRLNKLGKKANRLTKNLNCGGCCVFASLVARALEQLRVPHEGVVSLSWGDLDSQRPMNNLDARAWYERDVHFRHVGLRVYYEGEAWLFDSNGVTEADEAHLSYFPLSKGTLSDEELHCLAGEPVLWNPMFQRTLIPKLQALVDEHLLQPLDRSEDDKLLAELGVTP